MAQCPKCGETSADGTVICPGCDYILDAAFLGDDILNERTGQQKPVHISSAGDAVVLGALDEPVDLMFSESTGSFLTADTHDVDRQIVKAPVYVGKSVQELMKPEAVLTVAPDIEKRKAMLSPFELHVLSFIDGLRPVARLRKKTGLSSDDLRIAVGMLAEKKAVLLAGVIAPPGMKRMLEGELDMSDEDEPETHENDGSFGKLGRGAESIPTRDLRTRDVNMTNDDAGEGEWHDATAEDSAPPRATKRSAPTTGEIPHVELDASAAKVDDDAKAPSPWSAPAAGGAGGAPGLVPGVSAANVSAANVSAANVSEANVSAANAPANAHAKPKPADASASAKPAAMPVMGKRSAIASPPVDRAAAEKAEQRAKAASFFELAHTELTKGNRVRAHVYAKLAAETDPSEPKYQELLKTWAVASRTGTTLENTLFADADTAEKQGNHHKAQALLQQALDANPNAAHVHNRMGLLLATRFKKFSQASEHLMRACELEPNNVVYKNNLGKIIAIADERSSRNASESLKPEKGFLGKLKKALE